MPLKGELSYRPTPTKNATIKIRIQLQSQNLMLRLIPATKEYSAGKKVLAWSWSTEDVHVTGNTSDVAISKEEAKELSLIDVISRATKE